MNSMSSAGGVRGPAPVRPPQRPSFTQTAPAPQRTSYTSMQQRLQSLKSLQTQPAVIARITQLLQNPATNAEGLGWAIRTDPVLSSSVLKLVNSAFYGFPGRIGSIKHAVVLLGFATVKNIVITASVMDIFKMSKGSVFNIQDIWKHSLACAAASQAIARAIGSETREECFMAGLLHDIGKAVMLQLIPDDFLRVAGAADKTKSLFYDTECKMLGVNHQEIGGMLVEQWRLPLPIIKAVTDHHNPPLAQTEENKAAAIVHCADILSRALGHGSGGDKKIPMVSDGAWDMIGMDKVELPKLFDSIENEMARAMSMFQL